KNRHISSALAELIRSTRAPTKDRLIGKIMGGNPAFRGTRVPVHMLAELVPSRARVGGGEVWHYSLIVFQNGHIELDPENETGRPRSNSSPGPSCDRRLRTL